jgi:hypothetical protein
MPDDFNKQANKLLTEVADALDISESNYEKAEQRYQAVGKWLERPDSKLLAYTPKVYSQGSFRLGTVVKPITDQDDYDIDLVCQVDMRKTNISQADLKQLVGDELKTYSRANNMNAEPEEGKRCWTMEYADGVKFHMDILPSVPDDESYKLHLQQSGIPNAWAEHAIALTDNRNPSYWMISNEWERSNPKGYALWFEEQMKVVSAPRRRLLVEKRLYAKIDDVPAFKWKTPLQRSIQLLKRHRDIMFEDEKEIKPISIIISTLAGHAYSNEANQLGAIINIINKMPDFIQRSSDGSQVMNPVNPSENFAEKWKDKPEKERAFRQWLEKAKIDVEEAVRQGDIEHLIESMKPNFGELLISKTAAMTLTASAPAISIKQNHRPPHVEIHNPNKPWGISG